MAWHAALGQAIGGRQLQEDSAGFGFDPGGEYGYAVVADGLGGHDSGEIASAAAVAAAASIWALEAADPARIVPADFIAEVVALAHQRVVTLNREANLNAMTTICCAVFSGDRVTVGNVGDTRAYLARGRKISRLSRDHSVTEMLLAQAAITEDEMRGHPDSNRLTQAIGGNEPARAFLAPEQVVRPDERLLLCSDGVWQSLSDDQLAVLSGKTPRVLVDAAAAAGGEEGDNVTALVITRSGGFGERVKGWLAR